MGYKNRDVEIIWLSQEQCLIVACDSCGGIGAKEQDVLKVDPIYVAQLITRNALLEVAAVGAKLQMITATIANEPEPTGRLLVDGIRKELEEAHLGHVSIVISTEKYFKTVQTSFGITMVASAMRNDLRVDCSKSGDYVYCLGLPRIGSEVIKLTEAEMIQSGHVEKLLQLFGVHDVIPVGSQGIYGEATALAKTVGAPMEFEASLSIDIHKPAGPCTCLLVTSERPLDSVKFEEILLSKIGCLI
jgi:hypothetical protein